MARTYDDTTPWHGFKSGTPQEAQQVKGVIDKARSHLANVPALMSPNRDVGIGRSTAQQPAAVVNLAGAPPETRTGGDVQVKVNAPAVRPLGQPAAQPASQAPVATPGPQQLMGQEPQGQSFTQFTDGGSGKMRSSAAFPKPGSTLLNAGDPNNPSATPVDLARLRLAGNQMGTTRGNGFEFHGTAADAAKFMAPVGNGPAMRPTGNMIQARSTSDHLPKESASPQMPQYMGKESGLGWKTRLGIYKEQMDAYNKATGNQNALDVNAMQEAGAGARAMLTAKGQNEGNQIAMQRLLGEQQVQGAEIGGASALSAAQQRLAGLNPGTPEYAAEERRIAGIMGRGSEKAEAPNIQMIEELVDPLNPLAGTTKRPVRISKDGASYDRVQEAGGGDVPEVTAPPPVEQRKIGQKIRTPKGTFTWTGKGWAAAE